jgi:peptide/nickel transport system permease protein
MLKVVLRRLVSAIPLLLAITLFVFLLFQISGIDPAKDLAGPNPTPKIVNALRVQFGLNGSFFHRYTTWVWDALHGNLGISYSTTQPVTTLIAQRYSIDLSLVVLSLVISLLVAVPAGILAALRPRGFMDRLVTLGSSLGIALPGFWLAILLVILFSVQLHWFPAIGYKPLSAGFVPWIRSLVLPAISLGLLLAASIALQLKAAMLDVMGKEYILAAEAKGLPEHKVVLKHALKNAAIPVVTVLGFRVAGLIGAAVLIENVFDIDGMGALAARGAVVGDVPVVLGITVVTTLFVLFVNLMVDMSYLYFDPRTRK